MAPGNGWHGDAARRGWFGDRDIVEDPRTGLPGGPQGWSKKTSAGKNFKKWAKGKTKAQIRKAKKDIKQFRRKHETDRARQKRLAHNRELRRTRPERMERAERRRDTDAMMKARRDEYRNNRNTPRRPVMACKWCPVDVELRGGQWVHVDGGPCRSHEYA